MSPDTWLRGLYWFTTVFGAGVTLVDMLGVLGHSAHHGHDGGDHYGDNDGDYGDNDGGLEDQGGHAHHDGLGHDGGHDRGVAGTLLSALRYVRTGIYFCLGFGPIGLIAVLMGRGSFESVLWAAPGGLLSAVLARAVFRFQLDDVDSSIREDDLLFQTARVTVSVTGGNMGKVRLRVGQIVAERYALAEDAADTFRPDEIVQIVRVTDECVIIRRCDDPGLLSDESPARFPANRT